MELSKKTWLLAIQFPDREQPSVYTIKGGDAAALLAKLIAARDRWAKVSGSPPSIVLCYEVGYDVFWLARFLIAHGIECLGGPADDVKRIGAADGVGASIADHVSDPVGPVRADMGDLGTSAFTGCFQRIEEGAHGRAFVAGMSPHQPAAVVVDHDGQVLVVAFV